MNEAARLGFTMVVCGALAGCGGVGSSGLGDSGRPDAAVEASAPMDAAAEAASPVDAGTPSAQISGADIDFGVAECGGSAPAQKTLVIQNAGTAGLTFDASIDTANFFFLVGPTSSAGSEPIPGGGSQILTIESNAVAKATAAGTEDDGLLTITTNDPAHATTTIHLKRTDSGATLALTPQTAAFGVVPLGTQATDIPLTLTNHGNESVSLNFTEPANGDFTVSWTGAPADVMVAPGSSVPGLVAHYTPSSTSAAQATVPIVVDVGGQCGTGVTTIPMSGQGASGAFSMQPQSIDFGRTACGTTSTLTQAMRTVTISNSGTSDFHVLSATLGSASSPYTVTLPSNLTVPMGGGTLPIVVNPTAVPQASAVTDNLYGDTLTITTDIVGDVPHTVTLTQTALGAILAFVPPAPISFPTVPIMTTSSASYAVANSGNAPATVSEGVSNMPLFSLSATAIGVLQGGDSAPESATFAPMITGEQQALVSLGVGSSDVLCAPLPQLSLSGTGTNGAISISSGSLDFGLVDCGTAAGSQSVTLKNTGTSAFTWNATLLAGSSYVLTLTNTTLNPGDSGTVAVRPLAIPQASAVTPDLYADTLAITTDIVGDSEHNLPMHMTARGAILVSSTTELDYGGTKVQTAATSQFTVSNRGNVAAAVTLTWNDSVFGVTPGGTSSTSSTDTIDVSSGAVLTGSFTPPLTQPYSDTAVFSVASGTALCGPLPADLTMEGTGTSGAAVVTPTNMSFGQVNCGTEASYQTVQIQNNGTAPFNFSAVLSGGASFPYTLSAPGGTVSIGNTYDLSVTPLPIPAISLTTPDLYADTLTITTDIAGDTPHTVSLHETAQGAILAMNTPDGTGILSFGSVDIGSTFQLSFSVTNSGNTTANASFSGFTDSPFTLSPPSGPALGGSALNVTVTFAPDASTATSVTEPLSVTTGDVLCAPLPPSLTLTGSHP